MVLQAGDPLYDGRYTILRTLGQGGMGITYLATTPKGNTVVVKTIQDQFLDKPNFPELVERFREEALKLAICRHPHIVEIENAFSQGSLFYLAMDYIQGQDLEKQLNQSGTLSEHEALTYIRQIGSALQCVHEKGLLHRDVKPANIMVCSQRKQAIFIDFGIASIFTRRFFLKVW